MRLVWSGRAECWKWETALLAFGLALGSMGAAAVCQPAAGPRPTVGERNPGSDRAAGPLDINTASAQELRMLPGMGDVYVRRVIDGRPYTAKNQLLTRGVLPQNAYEKLRDLIVAHRPVRPD